MKTLLPYTIIGRSLLLLLLLFLLLPGCIDSVSNSNQSDQKNGDLIDRKDSDIMEHSENATRLEDLPLDRNVPPTLQTATFALG